MKARFVYENLEFERGKDPKAALGIGKEAFRLAAELGISMDRLKALWKSIYYLEPEPEDVMGDGRATKKDFEDHLYGLEDDPEGWDISRASDFYEHIVWANNNRDAAWKLWNLEKEEFPTNESLDFERTSDPSKSMGLGVKSQIYQGMYDVAMNISGVLGMEMRGDADSDRVFLKIKYSGDLYNSSEWKKDVKKYLGKYIQEDKTPGVEGNYYFEIYPEYVKYFREILEEDSRK